MLLSLRRLRNLAILHSSRHANPRGFAFQRQTEEPRIVLTTNSNKQRGGMRGRATWNPRPTSNRRILARFLLAVSARLAFPRITPLCPHGDARREKETQDTRGGGGEVFLYRWERTSTSRISRDNRFCGNVQTWSEFLDYETRLTSG